MLWIEYRGQRAPIARVKTYDAAHNARPSIIEPLAMSDASSNLTIIGIPAGTERRVNIGVLDSSPVPITVQIAAFTRTGQQVGRILQQTLDSDEVFYVADADRELRVRLDETMTVRVKMLSGSAMAYASVVDLNGDSQFRRPVTAMIVSAVARPRGNRSATSRRGVVVRRRGADVIRGCAGEKDAVSGCLQPHRGKELRRSGATGDFISFSHSGDYGAAAVDARPVGIDIEVDPRGSERAAHLFLMDNEIALMERCDIAHRMLHF